MHASVKVLAVGIFATLAALASMTASAQQTTQGSDGSDYRPMQSNSTAPRPEVSQGAMDAARPTGTEPVGQSTSAPMGNSRLTREEVYKGAVEASHPMQTEALGQSTGMAGITSGTPH